MEVSSGKWLWRRCGLGGSLGGEVGELRVVGGMNGEGRGETFDGVGNNVFDVTAKGFVFSSVIVLGVV